MIDSDNNNIAKAGSKLPSLVPVQVTVSTQESFDDDFEQRMMMNGQLIIHSFIMKIYIAPFQGYYSEALHG